jgi:hypothetical protein
VAQYGENIFKVASSEKIFSSLTAIVFFLETNIFTMSFFAPGITFPAHRNIFSRPNKAKSPILGNHGNQLKNRK